MQTNMKKTTTKMFLLVLSASFLAVMASAQPATFNFNTLEGLNVLSYTGTIGASSPYVGAQGRCTGLDSCVNMASQQLLRIHAAQFIDGWQRRCV